VICRPADAPAEAAFRTACLTLLAQNKKRREPDANGCDREAYDAA
jgi:hypothetical protein